MDPGSGPDEPTDADDPTAGGPPADPGGGTPPPARDDDAAWAAIVANFGERASLDDPSAAAPPARSAGPAGAHPDEPSDDPARLRRLFEPFDRPAPRSGEDPAPADADLAKAPDAPYVPPAPPPVPRTTADRRAAWAGVIGGPTLLLLALLVGLSLPAVVVLALVVAFVGGFVYLVVKMPREPRDPGDDGARV